MKKNLILSIALEILSLIKNTGHDTEIMSETTKLLDDLKASDVTIRKRAIFTIGDQKLIDAIPSLIDILQNDSDNVVRNSAARALGKLAIPSHYDIIFVALEKALEDSDYYVRANACWSLGKINDPRVILPLMNMVDPRNRLYTMVGDAKTQESVDEISASDKLKEEGIKYSDVIVESVKALGNIGNPLALPALFKALEDEEDGSVRCAACLALGQIKDPSAVPALIDLLRNEKYWYVRRDAIKALGNLKDPRASSEIFKKADDMYDEVREVVKTALINIGKPAAHEIVKLFLKNPKDPTLTAFVTTQFTRDEFKTLLRNLVITETNESQKKLYQMYLDRLSE